MDIPHILVVHNEPAIRRLVADSLGQHRIQVSFARDGVEGLSLLEKNRVHVLLTSPDVRGVDDEFVRQAASIHPLLGVVLLVDSVPPDNCVDPRQPCQVYRLAKAVGEDGLRAAIWRALAREMDRRPAAGSDRIDAVQSQLAQRETRSIGSLRTAGGQEALPETERIIAKSRAMREILELVRRAAPTDFPVLICGEPDTGKERIAREIHRQSRRAARPLVRIACGAIPAPELAEKLFGPCEHLPVRGGQPPATLLEEAQGGTLFLENVSQLPLWGQAKLLDVLQRGWHFHACPGQGEAVDVRVIASSAVNLQAATAKRAFSSRLFHFLNVVQICVPPLRHRPQDVRALAQMYLHLAGAMPARQGAGAPCRFSEAALACLCEHDWPGNALQLASVVAHAVLLTDDGEIGRTKIAESFGRAVPEGDSETISVPLAGGLRQIERAVIEAVIERCRGNKAAAARALRLHRRTLYRILREDVPAKKDAAALPLAMAPGLADFAAAPVAGNPS